MRSWTFIWFERLEERGWKLGAVAQPWMIDAVARVSFSLTRERLTSDAG